MIDLTNLTTITYYFLNALKEVFAKLAGRDPKLINKYTIFNVLYGNVHILSMFGDKEVIQWD